MYTVVVGTSTLFKFNCFYICPNLLPYVMVVFVILFLSPLFLVYFIDSYVEEFFTMFNKYYSEALATDFEELSLQEQIKYVKHLYKVHCREREKEKEMNWSKMARINAHNDV